MAINSQINQTAQISQRFTQRCPGKITSEIYIYIFFGTATWKVLHILVLSDWSIFSSYTRQILIQMKLAYFTENGRIRQLSMKSSDMPKEL